MVALVPMTPMRPDRLAASAASAAGSTTPQAGTGRRSSTPGAVELTVPQAAMIRLTPPPIRKRQSCSAYFSMVSRLRVP